MKDSRGINNGEIIINYIVYFNTFIFAEHIASNRRRICKRCTEKYMAAVVACFTA
jgi:hypothetical protein